MNKSIVWSGVAIVAVAAAGLWYMRSGTSAPAPSVRSGTADISAVAGGDAGAAAAPKSPDAHFTVQEFTVDGKNFAFSPSELRVKQGDQVKLTFKDDEGFHDLVVDGYDVRTKRITAGNTAEVTFTADKKGTFAYYCSVGDHREEGMEGKLIVE